MKYHTLLLSSTYLNAFKEKISQEYFVVCVEYYLRILLWKGVSFLVLPSKRENEKANLVYYLGKINVNVTRAPHPSGVKSESDTAQ